jgi:hypothetical protein
MVNSYAFREFGLSVDKHVHSYFLDSTGMDSSKRFQVMEIACRLHDLRLSVG